MDNHQPTVGDEQVLVRSSETATTKSEVEPEPGSPEWLEAMGRQVQEGIADVKALNLRVDKTTVERYYETGQVLISVRSRLAKGQYEAWLRNTLQSEDGAKRNRDLTMVGQMIEIAEAGPRILRYARLGKNRVLQVKFLVKDLPEYKEGDPEAIDAAFDKLEAENPFPREPDLEAEDVGKFRVHMDALITQFRIAQASATGGTGEPQLLCSFDKAKTFARKKKLAIEVAEANARVTEWLSAADPHLAMVTWLDSWAKEPKKQKEVYLVDHKRLPEQFAKLKEWAEKLCQTETAKDEITKSPEVYSYVLAIRDEFDALISGVETPSGGQEVSE